MMSMLGRRTGYGQAHNQGHSRNRHQLGTLLASGLRLLTYMPFTSALCSWHTWNPEDSLPKNFRNDPGKVAEKGAKHS